MKDKRELPAALRRWIIRRKAAVYKGFEIQVG